MNKNEPIIINKAGAGYLVKPLSYMFHDEGEETFEVFSDVVALSVWIIDHFETAPDIQKTISTHEPGLRTHSEPVETIEVIGGGKNVTGTKQNGASKTKK